MADNNYALLLAIAALICSFFFLRSFKSYTRIKVAKQQSVPSKTRKEGESAIYRHHTTPHGAPLTETHKDYPKVKTVYDAFQSGLEKGPDRPFLGTRVNDGPYVFESYEEVHQRALNFGSGLKEVGLTEKEDFLGIYAKNCPEWVISVIACSSYNLKFVPLYDTLGPEAIQYILNQTKLSIVVVEADKLQNILSVAPKCPSLKYVIKMGPLTAEDKKAAKEAKVSLLFFKGVEDLGKFNPKDLQLPKPDDLFFICYTSGTTGDPKGVMISHKNVIADAAGVFSTFPEEFQLTENEVHLSFLPLAHIFEQLVVTAMMAVGAQICFYRGDVLKLLDDVALAKPTIFPTVPRLLSRVYAKILSSVNESSFFKRFLFNQAIAYKKSLLRKGIVTRNTLWDHFVLSKVQARLGGRVKIIVTGAAPISNEVLDFMRACFGCEVLEGYGQTETCAAVTVTQIGDYSTDHNGHVGAVVPSCEIKLVDIPDLDYLSTDQPHPRGEVCIRGNIVFKGYFKDQEKTHDTLDEDGWCHTGDVGMFLPNGTLKIIDRKKHLFKLSQGEYIAPEKIENIYQRAEYVAGVFVYGESLKSCLVGVVVPEHDQAFKWAKENNIKGDMKEICQNPKFNKEVLNALIQQGKQNKLHSFEQVKAVYLEPEPFTPENGMLTPTFKLKREALKKKYKKEIEKMYSQLDA